MRWQTYLVWTPSSSYHWGKTYLHTHRPPFLPASVKGQTLSLTSLSHLLLPLLHQSLWHWIIPISLETCSNAFHFLAKTDKNLSLFSHPLPYTYLSSFLQNILRVLCFVDPTVSSISMPITAMQKCSCQSPPVLLLVVMYRFCPHHSLNSIQLPANSFVFFLKHYPPPFLSFHDTLISEYSTLGFCLFLFSVPVTSIQVSILF